MIEEAHRKLGLSTSEEVIKQKRNELYKLLDERHRILSYELT